MAQKIPNEETGKAILNIRNGTKLSRDFHSVSDLMEELYIDDRIVKNEYDVRFK